MQAELILDAAMKYDIHMFEGHLAPAATTTALRLIYCPDWSLGAVVCFGFGHLSHLQSEYRLNAAHKRNTSIMCAPIPKQRLRLY